MLDFKRHGELTIKGAVSMTATIASDTTSIHTVTVNGKALAGILADVLLFASKDKTLPPLNAVQLQGSTVDGTAVIVARATDRYVLAETWMNLDSGEWPTTPILVNMVDIQNIISVLKKTAFSAQITIVGDNGKTYLTVTVLRTTTTASCDADSKFPKCDVLWLMDSDEDPKPVLAFTQPEHFCGLISLGTVAKRRKGTLRIHANRKANILATVGNDFRALVMTDNSPDSKITGILYSEPSYS